MSPDPSPLELVLRELEQLRRVVEDTVKDVSSLKLWRAWMQGVGFAYRWVPAIAAGLLSAGATAAVTLLLAAH